MFNFSLDHASFIINSIAFLVSYMIAATTIGYFSANITYYLGDTTAYQRGLCTFNPVVHIDVLGLLLLAIMGIGWGLHTPITPSHIEGNYVSLRRFLLYFSSLISALFTGTIAFLIISVMLGHYSTELIYAMVQYNNQFMSQEYLTSVYPYHSSITITYAYLLITFIYVSILCAWFNLISNCYQFVLSYYDQDDFDGNVLAVFMPFVISTILLILFTEPFRHLMLAMIMILGRSILAMCGVV